MTSPAIDRSAMRGLATGNREGKAEVREQTVLTPQNIVDVLHATWPEGVALDPCTAAGSIVPAQITYNIERGENGLQLPWRNRTYCNSPYKTLKEWLDKSEYEHGLRAMDSVFGAAEQILLVPVRPNRVWWCKYMSSVPSVIAWLKPVKFLGFKSGFPAPLCLVYTGSRTEAFSEACIEIATHVGGRI